MPNQGRNGLCERVAHDLLPSTGMNEQKGKKMIVVQCCVCMKIRRGDVWVKPHPHILSDGYVSHGYCPTCAAEAFAQIHRRATTGSLHNEAGATA